LLDRAGLVGEDGPTHHGLFDIAYLRHIPKLAVMAPADTDELKLMLDFAVGHNGPVAIRYPRGAEVKFRVQERRASIQLGVAEVLKEGRDVAILALGTMVSLGQETAALLENEGISAAVVNARFVKPLDKKLLEDLSKKIKRFITLEEGVIEGGFGSAVLEFLEEENIWDVEVKRIGLPSAFIEHGSREQLFRKYNLTPAGIAAVINPTLFAKYK